MSEQEQKKLLEEFKALENELLQIHSHADIVDYFYNDLDKNLLKNRKQIKLECNPVTNFLIESAKELLVIRFRSFLKGLTNIYFNKLADKHVSIDKNEYEDIKKGFKDLCLKVETIRNNFSHPYERTKELDENSVKDFIEFYPLIKKSEKLMNRTFRLLKSEYIGGLNYFPQDTEEPSIEQLVDMHMFFTKERMEFIFKMKVKKELDRKGKYAVLRALYDHYSIAKKELDIPFMIHELFEDEDLVKEKTEQYLKNLKR